MNVDVMASLNNRYVTFGLLHDRLVDYIRTRCISLTGTLKLQFNWGLARCPWEKVPQELGDYCYTEDDKGAVSEKSWGRHCL